jgi:ABC-type transport system substrate-binding protein
MALSLAALALVLKTAVTDSLETTPPPIDGPMDGTAALAAPRRGGTLRLAGRTPSTLDPAVVRDVSSADYIYEIFSGLVSLSPELEIVPDLAESWQVDPDRTVYTFTLRTGVRFHDGRPLTAQDVVFSLERACDPSIGSDVAATYLGDIVGCADKLAGRAGPLAGVKQVGDLGVALTIDAPKSYFLAKLTYPTSFVVDRHQVADPEWMLQPNGTGPFKVTRFVPEDSLRLERNAAYFGHVPYLDAVDFSLRPVSASTLYENGELDAVPAGLGTLDRARDPLNPLSHQLMIGPGDLSITYLAFNVRRAPFDDAHLRRAFNFALDKAWLAEVVLEGAATPAEWILPPGMPGHTPDISPFRYDPEAARDELAASRYGGPQAVPPLRLAVSGEGGLEGSVAAIVDELSATLGVSITVEQAPWEQFQKEMSAGEYDMWILGWSADYPDPQDFLDLLFHSSSPLNQTGYSSPPADQLLEEARLETDDNRRLELYAQAERLILEEAPWLPLYSGLEAWLVKPYVHGFRVPPVVVPKLGLVWLEEGSSP